MVVALTQLLTDAHPALVRMAAAHPSVASITVLSAVSEIAHAELAESPLGTDAFAEYGAMLLEDASAARRERMGANKGERIIAGLFGGPAASDAAGLHVEIKHFPVSMCPVDKRSFVLPSAAAAVRRPSLIRPPFPSSPPSPGPLPCSAISSPAATSLPSPHPLHSLVCALLDSPLPCTAFPQPDKMATRSRMASSSVLCGTNLPFALSPPPPPPPANGTAWSCMSPRPQVPLLCPAASHPS